MPRLKSSCIPTPVPSRTRTPACPERGGTDRKQRSVVDEFGGDVEQEQRPGKRERAGIVGNSVDVVAHAVDMRQVGRVGGRVGRAEDLKEPARGCVLPRSWLGWVRTQRPRVPAHLRRQRLVGLRRTGRRVAFRSKRRPAVLYHGRAPDISGFVRRPHLHVTSSAAHSMLSASRAGRCVGPAGMACAARNVPRPDMTMWLGPARGRASGVWISTFGLPQQTKRTAFVLFSVGGATRNKKTDTEPWRAAMP